MRRKGSFGVQRAAAVRTSTVGMRFAETQPPVSKETVPPKGARIKLKNEDQNEVKAGGRPTTKQRFRKQVR